MVHQADAPNPVPNIVDALKRYGGIASEFIPGYGHGLQGVANREGIQTPDWSQKLGSVLSSPEANAALGALKLSKPVDKFLNEASGKTTYYHDILDTNKSKSDPAGSATLDY